MLLNQKRIRHIWVVFVVLLASFASVGCKKKEEANVMVNLPEYISFKEDISIPEGMDLPEYEGAYQVLHDTGKFYKLFFEKEEELKVKEQLDEGIKTAMDDSGYLITVMQNIEYFKINNGNRIFDNYSYWLSLRGKYNKEMRYSFLPEQDKEDMKSSKDAIELSESLLASMDTPCRILNYRNEKTDYEKIMRSLEEVYEKNEEGVYLEETGNPKPGLNIYRSFFRFYVGDIPVLAPNYKMIFGQAGKRGKLKLPYLEIVEDQNGIAYLGAWNCPIKMEKSKNVIPCITINEVIGIFCDYFEDMIIEDTERIVINKMKEEYVLLSDSKTNILTPAWVIGFEKGGEEYSMAIDMKNGDVL